MFSEDRDPKIQHYFYYYWSYETSRQQGHSPQGVILGLSVQPWSCSRPGLFRLLPSAESAQPILAPPLLFTSAAALWVVPLQHSLFQDIYKPPQPFSLTIL